MKYGYCRISTNRQNLERQCRNILSVEPTAKLIEEVYTGTTANRPKWQKLLKEVKAGDVLIFDSVSRMSRNADEGIETYETLYKQGVELVFLKEPHINTQTYREALEKCSLTKTGTAVDYILQGIEQYLLELAKAQIRLAFEQAQKEVDDLRQRTAEGIETARREGKQIGLNKGAQLTTKKSVEAKQAILKYSKDFGGTLSDAAAIKLIGISRNSYYKYKKELKEN